MNELILILGVVSFSFWVKAIAGFGGPLLAVPLLAPFLGVEQAVVVVSIANIVSNLMLLWSNRHAGRSHGRLLLRLLLAGALGTVLGTILLTSLDDRVLALTLAASVVVYIVINLARPDFRLSSDRGLALAVPVGAVGGLMHGALGNSGTVFGSFYHSLRMPRDEYVFSLTVTFLAFGTLQIGTLARLGSFGEERLVQAALSVLPVLLVTPLGERISRRLDARVFGWVVLGLLAFSAMALVAGAI